MIHSLRTIDRDSDRDVIVNYDIISHEVQSSAFQHIAVKSNQRMMCFRLSHVKTLIMLSLILICI